MFNLSGPRYSEALRLRWTLAYLTRHGLEKPDVRPGRRRRRRRPEIFFSLMLAGDLAVDEDPVLRRELWRPGWETYYPAGPEDPDYTVLRFDSRYGRGWNGSVNYFFDLSGKR